MKQSFMFDRRVLVRFSCGAASAVAAKMAVEQYGDAVEICYYDLFASEHPDNRRFLADVERWTGKTVTILRSRKYANIWDVFRGERYIVGKDGAPCTREMKRRVGKEYADISDWNVFGFTADEGKRIERFEDANRMLSCIWILRDAGITKGDCYRIVQAAGIELPAMYRLGYRNNNCVGCVKGGAGYWNKIRSDFPVAFARMAALEREIGHAICRVKGEPCYLDELPPDAGRYDGEPDIECGPQCVRPE